MPDRLPDRSTVLKNCFRAHVPSRLSANPSAAPEVNLPPVAEMSTYSLHRRCLASPR